MSLQPSFLISDSGQSEQPGRSARFRRSCLAGGTSLLLAGCWGLFLWSASLPAAEWNGIQVADPAPAAAVTGGSRSTAPAPAGSSVQEVWDSFVGALRNGRMKDAYALLSPAAQEEMNYRDFCAAWHPLSLKYEEVLSPPGFSEFRISGDIATLRLGLRQSPRGTENAAGVTPVYGAQGDFLQAVLVKEDGRWRVLEGRNMEKALAEAAARNVLRRLVQDSVLVRESLRTGEIVTLTDLQRQMPRFFEEAATREFLENYQLEIDTLRDGVLRARPLRDGLRGYQLGADRPLAVLPPEAKPTPAAMILSPRPVKKTSSATAVAVAIPKPLDEKTMSVTQFPHAPVSSGDAISSAPVAGTSTGASTAPGKSLLPPPAPSFGDPDRPQARPSASRMLAQAGNGNGYAPVKEPVAGGDFALPELDERPVAKRPAAVAPETTPVRAAPVMPGAVVPAETMIAEPERSMSDELQSVIRPEEQKPVTPNERKKTQDMLDSLLGK